MNDARAKIFTDIYTNNRWNGVESPSGPGSDMAETVVIRRELPAILKALGVRTMLDASCGTFNWMRELDYSFEQYIGMDIVPQLIAENESRYGTPNRRFVLGDIVEDELPKVDFILCRDCLNHLSLEDATKAISQFRKSGSRFLGATTYPSTLVNSELATWWVGGIKRPLFQSGDHRPLNLQLLPFDLPRPTFLIDEKHPAGKQLGVWR
jgi:SAM-dependent methyltransferase